MGEPVRLNKLIASRGIASRREADRLIQEGEVTVNGQLVTEPGTRVDPDDSHVKVHGRLLPRDEPEKVYVLLHKPAGVVTTDEDPEGRTTVQALLSELRTRVEPVGRLDYGTEGALLLTNDGDLAHRLTHPRFHVPKVYLVKVAGQLVPRKLAAIEAGLALPDGRTQPAEVVVVEARERNTWVQVTVTEGRNRLVRRMMEFLGHRVLKLKRTAFAGLPLGDLPAGRWRLLSPREIEHLRAVALGETSQPLAVPRPEGAEERPRRRAKKPGWAVAQPRRERHGRRRAPPAGSGGGPPVGRRGPRRARAPEGERSPPAPTPTAGSEGGAVRQALRSPVRAPRGERDKGPGRRTRPGGKATDTPPGGSDDEG